MGKPLYEFGPGPFRDELLVEYILPAASWFMRDPSSAYLLPQASGSAWECSLAIEYLLSISRAGLFDSALQPTVDTRTVATARWMMQQLRTDGVAGRHWDGAPWDTAVVLRAVLHTWDAYASSFSAAEVVAIESAVKDVILWLGMRVSGWGAETRYWGGPPDLAQVLYTLIDVSERDPSIIRAIESKLGYPAEKSLIDDAARMLLSMVETGLRLAPDDSQVKVSFWVDAFNSSEVIDALSKYVDFRESRLGWAKVSYEGAAKKHIIQCIRFIECTQSQGSWGGVADTCGTLYGYMAVMRRMKRSDHQDHVIFKGLRWMCDVNQSFDDGSFVHSTYVTVFYALALWEIYSGWPLAGRPGSEVYDVSLWKMPNVVSSERSVLLEMEILHDELGREYEGLKRSVGEAEANRRSMYIGLGVFTAVLFVVWASGSLSVDTTMEIKDAGTFWAIVAIGLGAIPPAIAGFRAISLRRRGG